MKRIALIILLLLFGGLVFTIYRGVSGVFPEHYQWNQRLTLVIDTPDGELLATSVTQGSANYTRVAIATSDHWGYGLYGEAIVADLGGGRYLFALLPNKQLAEAIFRDLMGDGDRRDLYQRLPHQAGMGARRLTPEDYPLLVTFGDVSDPASVVQVDPADLAATFGAGFALREITLEVTDDAVTEGVVEGVLGWLEPLNGGYLHGGFTSKGAPLGLSGLEFIRGEL